MTINNTEQLAALELLARSTRQLIDAVVQLDAPAADIHAFISNIDDMTRNMQALPQGRSLPHYDLSLAKSRTNYTLPYSPVCGPYNPVAPPVDMHYDAETAKTFGRVRCGLAYEGPRNHVHGAVIAGIYDQLLALASACLGQPSFTAYLHIDYRQPTPLHEELLFEAWIGKIDGRKMIIKGQCTCNNIILTECEGLFIQSRY